MIKLFCVWLPLEQWAICSPQQKVSLYGYHVTMDTTVPPEFSALPWLQSPQQHFPYLTTRTTWYYKMKTATHVINNSEGPKHSLCYPLPETPRPFSLGVTCSPGCWFPGECRLCLCMIHEIGLSSIPADVRFASLLCAWWHQYHSRHESLILINIMMLTSTPSAFEASKMYARITLTAVMLVQCAGNFGMLTVKMHT